MQRMNSSSMSMSPNSSNKRKLTAEALMYIPAVQHLWNMTSRASQHIQHQHYLQQFYRHRSRDKTGKGNLLRPSNIKDSLPHRTSASAAHQSRHGTAGGSAAPQPRRRQAAVSPKPRQEEAGEEHCRARHVPREDWGSAAGPRSRSLRNAPRAKARRRNA